jgi:DNA-binding transcriptional ArsR family regulator
VYQPDVTDMASASEDPRTILLDNVDPGFAQLLFGRFRDVLWQFPHRWVVAGDLDRRTQYLEQPADAFFDVIVELEELSTQDGIELLRRRAEAAGDLAEASRLRELAPAIADAVPERTPGRVLGAARLALLGGSLGDAGELQQRAAALGRSAALLFAEVEALGPVHAGDQRLLRRLGYTRPRIVQLLKELEEGGLVVARPEGRRKMYEVAKPQREKATVPT